MKGSYLLLVPDWFIDEILDNVKDVDEFLIFRPEYLNKENFFDECSVADVSLDEDGCPGQG